VKILVTGGAGFIGSHFARLALKKGYKVVIVDNLTYAGDLERIKDILDEITFYKCDISNKEFLDFIFKKEKIKIVVHFAAESHVDRSILKPDLCLKTNILGTHTLLEVSKNAKIDLFINISTDEVYGDIKKGENKAFKETDPLKPSSPYASSKASQDFLGQSYYRTYKLPIITIRPSNNYGPWQYPEKFVPVVILKAIKGEKIPIYGTGENEREWLYVEDCVSGILLAIEKGKIGEIYNLGSGKTYKNIDVARHILLYLDGVYPRKDKKSYLEQISFVKDRPGHDFKYFLDSSKIKKELGFKTKISFEEGIKKTVNWYLSNLTWLESKLKSLQKFWEKVY